VRITTETYLSIGDAVAIVADAIISSTTIVNESATQPENYIPNIGIASPVGTPVTANGTVVLTNPADIVNYVPYRIANTFPSSITITQSGFPYNSQGNYLSNSAVIVESPATGFGKWFNHSLNVTESSYKFPRDTVQVNFANTVANTNSNISFFVEEEYGYYAMWIYANSLPTSASSPAGLVKITGAFGVDTGLVRGESSNIPNVHTKILAVDDQGRIVLSRRNAEDNTPEVLTTDSVVSTNNWIHIVYALDDYNGNNYQRVFANGVLKSNQTVDNNYLGIACFSNTHFGYYLERNHHLGQPSEISCVHFDGFIDDIHINSDSTTLYTASATPSFSAPEGPTNPNDTTLYLNQFIPTSHVLDLVANNQTLSIDSLTTRTNGQGYSEPNQYNTHISYNVEFPQANTRTAVLSAEMVSNKLNSISISDSGFGYLPSEKPKITITPIEDPESGRLIFEDGNTILSENVRLEDADSSANNQYFTQQAGSEAYDATFIDFNDQNPFSEGGNW
jgi:hypothetical protein